MELIVFEPWHMDHINEQTATAYLRPMITAEHIRVLAMQKHSYTAVDNGRILACGGVIEHYPGRGEAWAVLDATKPKDFLKVHNAAKRFFDMGLFARTEAVVEIGFEAGHRWLVLLGFKLEAPCMKHYGPDGRDYSLYARTV